MNMLHVMETEQIILHLCQYTVQAAKEAREKFVT